MLQGLEVRLPAGIPAVSVSPKRPSKQYEYIKNLL